MKGGSLHCQNCRYFSSCMTYCSNNARIFCFECPSKACGCKEVICCYVLPLFKYGDRSRITTLCGSDSLAECSSSFPKYEKALHRYLVSLSTNIQNFIPNLSGLFAMYWVNLHLALDGRSYSSAVRFSPGL